MITKTGAHWSAPGPLDSFQLGYRNRFGLSVFEQDMNRVLVSLALLVATTFSQDNRADPKNAVESAFLARDKNGDGRLTQAEFGESGLFQRLDQNDDGFVTRKEAHAFYAGRSGRRHRRAKTPAGSGTIRINRDISYSRVKGVDRKLLSLDLYAPKSKGPHPVMVMVHGGGWSVGDKAHKSMTQDKVPHFTGAGYVYISINYRLSPAVVHPVHAQDVACALAWVHDNVTRYGGTPDRIFIMGHSAGAHLVALVATDARYLHANREPLAILKGAVLLDSAAYNIPRLLGGLGGPKTVALYKNAFGSDPKAWRGASPLFHVAPKKHVPPFLIFHTQRETAASISREFAKALSKAGVPARTVNAPDRDHGGMNRCIGKKNDP